MASLLAECEHCCYPCVDDVSMFSNDWKEHVKHIDLILGKLEEAKLEVKLKKCKFAQNPVKYLGHLVEGGCRSPKEAKIKTFLDLPSPKTKTEIRKVLGMTGYYMLGI